MNFYGSDTILGGIEEPCSCGAVMLKVISGGIYLRFGADFCGSLQFSKSAFHPLAPCLGFDNA